MVSMFYRIAIHQGEAEQLIINEISGLVRAECPDRSIHTSERRFAEDYQQIQPTKCATAASR
jgi:hypothetical protein